jgi:dolichol-phosphate mannosyltransferase
LADPPRILAEDLRKFALNSDMKTCVLIPSYNESRTIGNLIKEIKAMNLDVVVVDDGSLDGTPVIARQAGAQVILHGRNMGKGISLRDGFEYALKKGYEVVITMDGDGQHDPKSLYSFLEKAGSSKAGIIIGNRMKDPTNMPFIRRLTNKFMSWILSRMSGQHIPDSQCGFRLINRGVLEKIVLSASKYEIESEILLRAAKEGFVIESIPIRTIYEGQQSSINPFFDTLRFIRLVLKTRS